MVVVFPASFRLRLLDMASARGLCGCNGRRFAEDGEGSASERVARRRISVDFVKIILSGLYSNRKIKKGMVERNSSKGV